MILNFTMKFEDEKGNRFTYQAGESLRITKPCGKQLYHQLPECMKEVDLRAFAEKIAQEI